MWNAICTPQAVLFLATRAKKGTYDVRFLANHAYINLLSTPLICCSIGVATRGCSLCCRRRQPPPDSCLATRTRRAAEPAAPPVWSARKSEPWRTVLDVTCYRDWQTRPQCGSRRCADMQSWHSSGFLPDNLQLGAYGAARERMHATAPPATTRAPIANTRRRPISKINPSLAKHPVQPRTRLSTHTRGALPTVYNCSRSNF